MSVHYQRGRDRWSRQSRVSSWRYGAQARCRRRRPRRHPYTSVSPPRQSRCWCTSCGRTRTRAASPQEPAGSGVDDASVEDPGEPRGRGQRRPESLLARGEIGGHDRRRPWVWDGLGVEEELWWRRWRARLWVAGRAATDGGGAVPLP